MKDITDKILGILESMATGTDAPLKTVIYGSPFDANVRLDRKPDPAAVLYIIKGFEVDTSTGLRYDKVDAEVFFCKRCELAQTGEKTKVVLDSVEPLVNEFMSLLFAEKSWRVSDKLTAVTAIGKFDANVAGYSLQFSLVSRQGNCI